MIKSMTGYGRAEEVFQGRHIVVEAKSVNHRFLEISLRLPSAFLPLELAYKKKIGEKFKRGRIEVFIRLEEGGDASAADLNLDVAHNYFNVLNRLKKEFGFKEAINLKMLTGFRDIFSAPTESHLNPDFLSQVETSLQDALKMLMKMRQEEGFAIYRDMEGRLESIKDILKAINLRGPQVVLEYQRRLTERIRDLTKGCELDDARLAQEVALMAEKSDITEEIVRLQSHISQFAVLLQSDEAEGKKIDFLLQEMNREINTIGSKSNDAEITRQVIETKSELGKLREQAQNIE
jgi:TIGR00255 family protein